MQSIFERICRHHSRTFSSPITTLKQIWETWANSSGSLMTDGTGGKTISARGHHLCNLLLVAICQSLYLLTFRSTAWAIYSPRHLLGNRNRISNRFPRGMPWFGRYLGNYITKKANYFKKKKKRNNLKINEDMHHLLQIDPKRLWKICVTMTISLKKNMFDL